MMLFFFLWLGSYFIRSFNIWCFIHSNLGSIEEITTFQLLEKSINCVSEIIFLDKVSLDASKTISTLKKHLIHKKFLMRWTSSARQSNGIRVTGSKSRKSSARLLKKSRITNQNLSTLRSSAPMLVT